jgi:hypothetical protein
MVVRWVEWWVVLMAALKVRWKVPMLERYSVAMSELPVAERLAFRSVVSMAR